MNCPLNCPYSAGINSDNYRPVLRHPQGNYLSLQMPLTANRVILNDGVITKEENMFPIYDVQVLLIKDGKEFPIDTRVNINVIYASDNGKLPIGSYDIVISFKGTDGNPYRYKKRTILVVADSMPNGGTYDTDEFNVIALYPTIKGRSTTIIVGDDDVVMSVGGGFARDDNPNDDYATVTAVYGDGSVELSEDEVIINI